MKVQDLRIGNLVYSTSHKAITKVIKLDFDSELLNIEPIPLTEEWLLKFGFELINNEFFKSRNSEICLFWTVNKNKMIPEYNEKRLITGYDFKHVHQLQNLYFALTGEELTL